MHIFMIQVNVTITYIWKYISFDKQYSTYWYCPNRLISKISFLVHYVHWQGLLYSLRFLNAHNATRTIFCIKNHLIQYAYPIEIKKVIIITLCSQTKLFIFVKQVTYILDIRYFQGQVTKLSVLRKESYFIIISSNIQSHHQQQLYVIKIYAHK